MLKQQAKAKCRFNLKSFSLWRATRVWQRRLEGLMRISVVAIAAGAFFVLGPIALAQTVPPQSGETAKGKALVDINGMTLYVFDRDASGKSNCNGPCAVNWPPLVADTDAKAAGDFAFITRDDGRKQWAYKGKPLYTWSKDKNPGDTNGDGVNNVWHIAAP
jgi:predicted lipoprotein with Yx(FWY)xxD motif